MRLAYICRNCTLDNGNSRIAWELAHQACREGHEVHLVARRFPSRDAGLSPNGVSRRKVFQLPKGFGPWRSLSFAWSSSRAARRLAGDGVVHGFGDSFSQDVVTIGNVDWNYGKKIPGRTAGGSAVKIKKTSLQNNTASFAVVVSRQTTQDVLDIAPSFSSSGIRVIYPGVHLDRFHPQARAKTRADLSLRYGIPERAAWIAMACGGDFEKRNTKALGEALMRLRERKDWVFVFAGARAGDFPWPQELSGRSYFLGPMPDLSQALPACDLFAYPAWFDEFAMVCLEAMASGIPLVLSRATGASEIQPAEFQKLSVLENPQDSAELARRIGVFLDDEALRRRLGEANRRAAESFSWESVYRHYRELYSEVLEKRGRERLHAD